MKVSAQQEQLPFDATTPPQPVVEEPRQNHAEYGESAVPQELETPKLNEPAVTGVSRDRPTQEPFLLTLREVEVALQLGRTRTYELVRSGALPVLRVGRAVRVPREALRRWIDDNCTAPE